MKNSFAKTLHGFYKRGYVNKLHGNIIVVESKSEFENNVYNITDVLPDGASILHIFNQSDYEVLFRINKDDDSVIPLESKEIFEIDFMTIYKIEFKNMSSYDIHIRVISGGLINDLL